MIRTGLLTVAVGLAGAQAAWAEPARTITIGAANPFVAFDGGPVTDFNAISGTVRKHGGDMPGRDETLIKAESAGRMVITSTSDGMPTSEIDLELSLSDASGTRGTEVSQGITNGPVERVAVRAKAGAYYLLSASGYPAVNASYKGEITLTVDAPAAPAVAQVVPVVATPPAPVARKKRTLTCARKARRIKSAKKRRAALRRCAKAKPGRR